MRIKKLHHNFILPKKSTERAGAFDVYMPEPGSITGEFKGLVGLGFSAEVPVDHVALLLPRSGAGSNHGVELRNTCGVIDSDFRGEWKAALKLKNDGYFSWESGDRLIQFLIVPVLNVDLELVDDLDTTDRGIGGFGSTGK